MKPIKVCSKCGVTSQDKRIITSKGVDYCSRCYQRKHKKIHPLPKEGEVKLDEEGNPICHICGEAHKKLMSHVCQVHGLSALKYKAKFKLDLYNGIMCEKSTEIARQRALEHLNINKQNLELGTPHRFIAGFSGRTGDKVSLQTRLRLKKFNREKKLEDE